MYTIYQLIMILIAAIAAVIPVLLIKKYIQDENKNALYIYLSIICEIVLVWAYSVVFEYSDISLIYTLLKVLTVIMVVAGGVFLYNEKLTILQVTGLFLALISIFILSV
jgi:multidrug transporter EmrE-like cation transporter